MALNKLLDSGTRSLTILCIELGLRDVKLITVAILKSFDNSYIILLLYVDDMLIARFGIEKISNLKKQLSKDFAMKDLGATKQILGMRIIETRLMVH